MILIIIMEKIHCEACNKAINKYNWSIHTSSKRHQLNHKVAHGGNPDIEKLKLVISFLQSELLMTRYELYTYKNKEATKEATQE